MRYFIILILLMTLLPAGYADLYQCKNNQGKTIFKDTPCKQGESLIKKTITPEPKINQNSLLPHPHKLVGKNLLINSSFENNLSGWNVPKEAKWEAKLGINSSSALSIRAQKPPMDKYIYETKVEQCVRLGIGSKYELAAQIKLETIPLKKYANRANVVWYESIDCTSGGQFGSYIEPKNNLDWQQIKRSNLTPALHAKSAKITLYQKGRYSKGGKAYWDNIHFAATEFNQASPATDNQQYTLGVGINYLQNGAFQTDVDSWRASSKTKWSQFIGYKEPGSARVTRYSSSGSRGSGAMRQCVNIGENRYFELGAAFKRDETSTAPGNGRLRITWYRDQYCGGPAKTDSNWQDPEPIAGWQTLKITGLTAPENSQSAVIEIIQSILDEGYFYAFWDDIYFRAIKPEFPSAGE